MDGLMKNRRVVMLATLLFSTAAVGASGVTFGQLDTDKDGRLSAVEASQDNRLSSMWTEVDQDKSGSIEPAEFSAFEATIEQADPTGMTPPEGGVK